MATVFDAHKDAMGVSVANDESSAQPSLSNLVGSVVGLFDLVGNTLTEQIAPSSRPALVVTESNYRELALAEIARQQTVFGKDTVGVNKQAAIVDAFRQLAGKGSVVPEKTSQFLLANVDKLSLSGQTKEFIRRANDFAATTVDRAGDVIDFATSPLGLTGLAAVAILAVFITLR